MLTQKITSLQHPLVLHWSSLRKEKKAREEAKSLLISGEVLISEVSQKIPIKSLITLGSASKINAKQHFLVSEEILKKITGLHTPPPFAAEVDLPPIHPIKSLKQILILDQLSDPGNLGTLIRTAHALGWEGVAATPGTVDFFNDKALRASRSSLFHLPYSYQTEEEIEKWAQSEKINLFLADLKGEPLSQVEFKKNTSLILSNEANGPADWAKKMGRKIAIPMASHAESLNVAVAGGILLYAMRPS